MVHQLAIALQKLRHDVTVVTWFGNARSIKATLPYNIVSLLPKTYAHSYQKLALGIAGWKWFGAIQVAALQRLHRFDVWNTHIAFPASVIVSAAQYMMRVPHVITCHGGDVMIQPEYGHGYRLKPELDKAITWALCRASALSAISPAIRAEYTKMGIPSERIFDIPNGVDVAKFAVNDAVRQSTRSNLGISPEQKVILTVGNYRRVKGFDIIPSVLKEVLRWRRDIVWILIGSGCQHVGEEAERLGMQSYIRVIAKKWLPQEKIYEIPSKDIVALYLASDLYVSTSYMEAFPVVLLEAMSAGLPVIASDIPAHLSILENYSCGITYPVGNSNELAKFILLLLSRPEKLGEMSRIARHSAERYEWLQIGEKYANLYTAITR